MCRKSKNMKFMKHTALITGLAVIYVFSCMSPAVAQSTPNYEYRLKATFIYQFVNFIDGWKFQQEKTVNNEDEDKENKEEIIVLGIIGEDPFGDAFKPLMDKTVRDRKIGVRRFEGFSKLKSQGKSVTVHPEIDQIKKCDLLFVCPSEQQYINEILTPLRNERILTIADMENFLEKGGIINFIIEKSKVRFEINVGGAKRAKLTIRSKLLRLATRIIMEDEIEDM
jgi:hypothetical protein